MATIKTVYTTLCMEPTGTASAAQSAWANVTNFAATPVFWAEVGWIKYRPTGSTTIIKTVFGEIGPVGSASRFVFTTAPAQDSSHTYKCELTDPANGTWTYYEDGTPFGVPMSIPQWINQVGTAVCYDGEIINKEDDMPGTPTDKCVFSSCQYKSNSGGGYINPPISSSDITSDDPNMWGFNWISQNSFEIWDKNP